MLAPFAPNLVVQDHLSSGRRECMGDGEQLLKGKPARASLASRLHSERPLGQAEQGAARGACACWHHRCTADGRTGGRRAGGA